MEEMHGDKMAYQAEDRGYIGTSGVSNAGSASPPMRDYIAAVLAEISGSMSALFKSIENLEIRIGPVCSPSSPTGTVGGEAKVIEISRSDVYHQLRGIRRGIDEMTARISELESRVDL
jgi:hypothetical protein